MSDARQSGIARDIAGLLIAVAICFCAASLGSLVTTPRIPNWYEDLAKPDWNPPAWIFGPVWSVLYLMMAVAAWLIWRDRGFAEAKWPLWLFALQLALNSLWSVLFFGLQLPRAAAFEIVLLWSAILTTIVVFWRLSRWAACLLMPYLAWVSFAVALNFAIWQLNR